MASLQSDITASFPQEEPGFHSHICILYVCVLEIEFAGCSEGKEKKKKLGLNYGYLRVWLVRLPAGYTSPVTDHENLEKMEKMPL